MTMSPRFHRQLVVRRLCTATLALVALLSFRQTLLAAELAEQAKSLRMVPADAAFYSASLHLKEQLDAFRDSNAYARLMEIQMVQLVKGQLEFQWQQASLPYVKQLREYVDSDEGQEVLAVLGEMFSDEVFVYGGSDVAQWLQFFMEINSINRSVRVEARADDEDPGKLLGKRLLEIIEQREDEFSAPTMVWGFRIQDAEKAERQLDTVQGHLRALLDDKQPALSARLQRDQIAGHEFLTMRLDGSMIPWDALREEVDEEDAEFFDKWRNLVSKKTLVVALGVIDGFVLISVGESTDHLENFGQGPFLADQEALKRLEKHADQRVASISYISQELAKNMGSPENTLNDMANSVDEALEQAQVDDELRQKLLDDIQSLNLSKYMPKPGETSAVVFMTQRGYEGFRYQTGTRPMMDSSKPLDILNHVGGNPLMFVASRTNDTVEDYNEASAWLKKTAGHVEEIAESKAEPDDWAKYLEHRDRVMALLEQLDQATRNHLYPALENCEAAFVIDASAESQHWTTHAPKSPKALPMIDFGLVTSVSDAESLKKAVKEYIDVLRDGIALAREIHPEGVPEIELPEAEVRDAAGGGQLFVFALPEEWGLDDQLAPTAGLTKSTAALTAMPATAERLLQPTPSNVDTSLDLKRPAASVAHCKFAELLTKIRPWIDYGLAVGMGTLKNEKPEAEDADEGEPEDADEASQDEPAQASSLALQMGFLMPQVYQVFDVLSAFRSVTLITYEEDGIWVTHSETHIEDLKKD